MIDWDYILYNIIYRMFYWAEIALCQVIKWMQDLFGVFAGTETVLYDKQVTTLFDVFLSNTAITGIFRGMTAIGIVLAFTFAIVSVARKGFDLDDKIKMSHGQILRNLLKSILLILSLNLVMIVAVRSTNVLLDQVTYVFDNAPSLAHKNNSINFTNEQYAAMSRIFNTVGNYSINPSYKNRYNINACYNEIRPDLGYLADTGVFDFYYKTLDKNGNEINTWQSVVQELAGAADYTHEVPADIYDEGIANAIEHCMTVLRTDNNFRALEHYDRKEIYSSKEVGLDNVIFLVGTMGVGSDAAARNEAYNKNPSLYDNVRAPYYLGEKSIYDIDEVNRDFDISFMKTNYIVITLVSLTIIINMCIILVSCVVRIFNLLFLYVIGPPIFATMSFDDGGKFKQWITAFVIQSLSIFATVISMRLFLIFTPIILSPKLQLTDSTYIDMIGKLVFICAGIIAVQKANGLLTGILADQAGHQAILSGDVSNAVKSKVYGATGFVKGAGMSLVGGVAGFLGKGFSGSGGSGSGRSGGSDGAEGSESNLPDKQNLDAPAPQPDNEPADNADQPQPLPQQQNINNNLNNNNDNNNLNNLNNLNNVNNNADLPHGRHGAEDNIQVDNGDARLQLPPNAVNPQNNNNNNNNNNAPNANPNRPRARSFAGPNNPPHLNLDEPQNAPPPDRFRPPQG